MLNFVHAVSDDTVLTKQTIIETERLKYYCMYSGALGVQCHTVPMSIVATPSLLQTLLQVKSLN